MIPATPADNGNTKPSCMKILTLDAAAGRCMAGIVADGERVAEQIETAARGQATLLPAMLVRVLSEAALAATALDLVAVTVGPGSFTGIRAGLALAHGIGLGLGVPVIGVTVGEALADCLPNLGHRRFWSATEGRRGRVFLEREGAAIAATLDDLPFPSAPVAVGGSAAVQVATELVARGGDVTLLECIPTARHLARVGARRFAGELLPLAAEPLYVDPPEARLPIGGLRPPPRV
jgi:tRNA threonylcarbamoyl adenosine modification protein YeaZ